jgi:Uma2 family endonuclease
MATVAEKLLTAEEFAKLPDPGYPTELVQGRIVEMPSPGFEHGEICSQIAYLINAHVKEQGVGRTLTNDSGVITERGPDSVRGPDVSYYSYQRVPRGTKIRGYADVPPEIVFEVLSPDDRGSKVLAKVAQYLEAGVLLVCVVNPRKTSAHLYRPDDQEPTPLNPDDDFAAPEILGDFRIPVRRFFE